MVSGRCIRIESSLHSISPAEGKFRVKVNPPRTRELKQPREIRIKHTTFRPKYAVIRLGFGPEISSCGCELFRGISEPSHQCPSYPRLTAEGAVRLGDHRFRRSGAN